jgi:hypothetical protein
MGSIGTSFCVSSAQRRFKSGGSLGGTWLCDFTRSGAHPCSVGLHHQPETDGKFAFRSRRKGTMLFGEPQNPPRARGIVRHRVCTTRTCGTVRPGTRQYAPRSGFVEIAMFCYDESFNNWIARVGRNRMLSDRRIGQAQCPRACRPHPSCHH